MLYVGKIYVGKYILYIGKIYIIYRKIMYYI